MDSKELAWRIRRHSLDMVSQAHASGTHGNTVDI